MTAADRRRRTEYGDFQTPLELAQAVCCTLQGPAPATIIEPTCGNGTFLAAAVRRFPTVGRAFGTDVNPQYVAAARRSLAATPAGIEFQLRVADFFHTDWASIVARSAEPILIIGNPPWVTNAALGAIGSRNHPRKESRHGQSGLDALTGKSNFDVSEWMIVRLLEAVAGRRAMLAMLCKTAVAHKVLAHAWRNGLPIERNEIRRIDALGHFGASVDACLLVCRLGDRAGGRECPVFDDLEGSASRSVIGLRDGRLVADVSAYDRVRHLVRALAKPVAPGQAVARPVVPEQAAGSGWRWRSGVKHDCAAVFEFQLAGPKLQNGLGERVGLESRYLYPLLKSSDIARGNRAVRRKVLVTQRRIGAETEPIADHAPKTWRYLMRHAPRLDGRASAVYRNQPRFSMFGVGPYAFCKWKVAVSGLGKAGRFAAVGPIGGRPVICDDASYFLPCRSAAEARKRARLLNGDRSREFFSAFVFRESKRPLTAEILGLLDLDALAAEQDAVAAIAPG